MSLAGVVIWLASRPDAAPQKMPELAGFAVGTVHTIEIIQGDGLAVTLKRHDSDWQLQAGSGNESRADDEAVTHLLTDLASMKPVRVVTRNPNQYEKLKVGSGATKVTLKDQLGGVLFAVLIGKQGSDLLSTYIRIADKPEVLAVNRSLLWQVSRPLDGWKTNEADPVDASNAGKSHE